MRTYNNEAGKYTVTIMQSANETDNMLSLLKINVQAGGGNNKHVHADRTETFKVLKGIISLRTGEEFLDLKTGDIFSVNSGIAHHFINKSDDTAELLVVVMPGSTEFENAIFEGADL